MSADVVDPEWDDWLARLPEGQFQQSSLWAQYKRAEGWTVARARFWKEGQPIGGFQLLHRAVRVGRVGYVTKGPVAWTGVGESDIRDVLNGIKDLALDLGLAAVIIQLPDLSTTREGLLPGLSFSRECFMGVIRASLWVNVPPKGEALMPTIPKPTRHPIRQAARRGVSVRAGGPEDLPRFFELMEATCRRQGVAPNPARLADLETLYQVFAARGLVELGLATVGGALPCAGVLCLYFGDRMSIWKKGWDGGHADCHPNHLLYYWALERANERGVSVCDFVSLDRAIAERLLAGRSLTVDQGRSRDRFHLGFGGQPRLLPDPWIWIPNRFWRMSYAFAAAGRRILARRKRNVVHPTGSVVNQGGVSVRLFA